MKKLLFCLLVLVSTISFSRLNAQNELRELFTAWTQSMLTPDSGKEYLAYYEFVLSIVDNADAGFFQNQLAEIEAAGLPPEQKQTALELLQIRLYAYKLDLMYERSYLATEDQRQLDSLYQLNVQHREVAKFIEGQLMEAMSYIFAFANEHKPRQIKQIASDYCNSASLARTYIIPPGMQEADSLALVAAQESVRKISASMLEIANSSDRDKIRSKAFDLVWMRDQFVPDWMALLSLQEALQTEENNLYMAEAYLLPDLLRSYSRAITAAEALDAQILKLLEEE